jgi:catalase
LIPEDDVPVRRVGRLVLDRCVDNFFAETEQVAFCTQNIVPGVDFTNDPLLQGRNFSYLDTQLKRLGSPNFTHLPINAPKCPFNTLQQDGQMAFRNPKGRVNYEPNSWSGPAGGPRETSERGFQSFASEEKGTKQRIRSETFADHYSQARQFYLSQTEVEQKHIAASFTFELSKVNTLAIRARMVSHLLNVDGGLGKKVADALRLVELPSPAEPARTMNKSLKPSPALSIIRNGPRNFAGRKLGVLITDDADIELLSALRLATERGGATLKLIAPLIGGVKASDGSLIKADETIDGGPSVLFDAIVLLVTDAGANLLADEAVARDFIADAFAHLKFIGYVPSAARLLQKCGVATGSDKGLIELKSAEHVAAFLEACGQLRHWEREARVKRE